MNTTQMADMVYKVLVVNTVIWEISGQLECQPSQTKKMVKLFLPRSFRVLGEMLGAFIQGLVTLNLTEFGICMHIQDHTRVRACVRVCV